MVRSALRLIVGMHWPIRMDNAAGSALTDGCRIHQLTQLRCDGSRIDGLQQECMYADCAGAFLIRDVAVTGAKHDLDVGPDRLELADKLSVKMNAWVRLFPAGSASGPLRRAEFMMSDMRQGIDRIRKIEDSAPMLSALES
jgi:hypothetical protein